MYKKLVNELQGDGAEPATGKQDPRPRAKEAADQVSATEAAAASKIVAQRLFMGLTEDDMVVTNPEDQNHGFPRSHLSPLLGGRAGPNDETTIYKLLQRQVSDDRQAQHLQDVPSIPMSFTTMVPSKTKKNRATGKEEIGKEESMSRAAEKKLMSIFRAKRREAKNDCGQKPINIEVRKNPDTFKEGTEVLPQVLGVEGVRCGIFQKGWDELFDKIFAEDEVSTIRLVSCTRLAIIRFAVEIGRANLTKSQTQTATRPSDLNKLDETEEAVDEGSGKAARVDDQGESGKFEKRTGRRKRAEGYDAEIIVMRKLAERELFVKWDESGRPRAGSFLCPDACCWLMDLSPLPDMDSGDNAEDGDSDDGGHNAPQYQANPKIGRARLSSGGVTDNDDEEGENQEAKQDDDSEEDSEATE